jgi:hypothetical protein
MSAITWNKRTRARHQTRCKRVQVFTEIWIKKTRHIANAYTHSTKNVDKKNEVQREREYVFHEKYKSKNDEKMNRHTG